MMNRNDIYYQNSKGEVVSLVRPPYMMLADTDIFDYTWEDGIRQTDDRSIKVVISGATHNAYQYALKRLTNMLEYDTTHGTYGRLYYKGWYLKCRLSACTRPASFIMRQMSTIEYTVSIDSASPGWHKDITHTYKYSDTTLFEGKGYPYGYAYGYNAVLSTNASVDIADSGLYDVLIKIRPNEAVASTIIRVGNSTYGAQGIGLDVGQVMTINTATRTIDIDGGNIFSRRVSDDMLHKAELEAGSQAVLWNDNFDFDLTLVAERSEPTWI